MRAEIFWIGEMRPLRLAVLPHPRGGEWLGDEMKSLKSQGTDYLISALTRDELFTLELGNEASACHEAGIEFVQHPIEDRSTPESAKSFVAMVAGAEASMRAGKGVAAHCRAGIGRASLIAAAMMILRGWSADNALAAIRESRGRDVPDTIEQADWLRDHEEMIRKHGTARG